MWGLWDLRDMWELWDLRHLWDLSDLSPRTGLPTEPGLTFFYFSGFPCFVVVADGCCENARRRPSHLAGGPLGPQSRALWTPRGPRQTRARGGTLGPQARALERRTPPGPEASLSGCLRGCRKLPLVVSP